MNRRLILKLTASAFVWPLVPKYSWAMINSKNQMDQRLVQTDALRICGYAGLGQNGRKHNPFRASHACHRPFLISWFGLPWAFNPDWPWNGKIFRFSPQRDGHFLDAYEFQTTRRLDFHAETTDQQAAEEEEKETRYLASIPLACPHCGHEDVDLIFVRGTPWYTTPVHVKVQYNTFYEYHRWGPVFSGD